MHKSPGCIADARGSTLVEMLVATCLLGICMVAVATSLRQSSHAMADTVYRQRAARLATDVAEILRGVSTTIVLQNEVPAAHDCGISACSGTQFIQAQLSVWQNRAARELPGGTAGFDVSRTGEMPIATIRVAWRAGDDQPGQHRLNIALAQ